MTVTFYKTAGDFLEAAQTWIEGEEPLNNLMLGLAANIAAGRAVMTAPPVMMTAAGEEGLQAALLMTTPRQWAILYSPPGSAAIEELVQAFLAAGHSAHGCVGPVAAAEEFVQSWQRRTGQKASLRMAQRIYELRGVIPPPVVPGRLRLATTHDLDLATRWRHEFEVEASHEDNEALAREAAERSIKDSQLFLWESEGQPVCQALAVRPTRHGICIGGVYTTPDCRRRGYATACVAASSQLQLDAGRQFCALYTDLANPTSNSIYQKIGYRPIADSSHYVFATEQETL